MIRVGSSLLPYSPATISPTIPAGPTLTNTHASSTPPRSPLALLRADAPVTLRLCARSLKSKPAKTRIGVLGVMRELAAILPKSVSEQAALLVPGIVQALNVSAGCEAIRPSKCDQGALSSQGHCLSSPSPPPGGYMTLVP